MEENKSPNELAVKTNDLKGNCEMDEVISPSIISNASINALTYRSFVGPHEARPDIAYYVEDKPRGSQADYVSQQSVDFRVRSSRTILTSGASSSGLNSKSNIIKKFGAWDGVCTSCLLNIFGVIMFLRLGWVVGQVGVPLSLVIIGISTVVTTLTTVSMAAICTNGEVREGGAYYLISRSIGPNIGGAIGFLFSLGMSVAVAMYVIGFCETLANQLEPMGITLTGNTLNDIRIYGLIVLFINLVMALIGTAWVIKMQIMLLVLLVAAIITFIAGTFLTDSDPTVGFVGYESGILSNNTVPEYTEDYDFFTVFGVFFPAVTGIMAGANISGDLKNPSRDIPLGTLVAIGVSTVVYMIMAVMCGAVAQRMVGDSEKFGLLFDSLIMVKVSLFKGTIVVAGIYAATFSSALASLVGAPRILQRLAMDGIIPFVSYFKKVRARDGAPVRGYIFSTVIAAGCILIGELNVIAPLITMFFMMTYGLINLACFTLSLSKAPGWRPTFKWFSWWSALLGAWLCLIIMFLTSVLYSIVSLIIGYGLYKYVQYKSVHVNWGSAVEARKDHQTLKGLMNLRKSQQHVKTFRPHYLVLIGHPDRRMWLVNLVETLRAGHGAVIYGNVIQGTFEEYFEIKNNSQSNGIGVNWDTEVKTPKRNSRHHKRSSTTMSEYSLERLRRGYWVDPTNEKTAGFFDSVIADNFRSGCQSLLQLGGVGRFRPNVVMMGYPENIWSRQAKLINNTHTTTSSTSTLSNGTNNNEEVRAYANTIRDVFRMGMNLMIARGFKYLDFEDVSAKSKESKSTLDVWWLADDGGLTILVSYLLILHDFWKNQIKKVNVYIVVESASKMDGLQIVLSQMLSKFRVKFGNKISWYPTPIVAKPVNPQQNTIDNYHKIAITSVENLPTARKHTVLRWLRVSELIKEHSDKANLIVCLIPFPRDVDESEDYLGLLEMLSDNGRPTILMRGNGQNCLTFQME